MIMRRGPAVAVLLLPFCLGGAPIAHTAAPEVIIFYRGVLDTPVYIAVKRETAIFSASVLETGSAEDLADRPHVNAALFWGMVWAGYARDSLKLRTLRPEQAEQQARIYLPRRSAEAPVFVFLRGAPDARRTRRMSPDGVRLLQRHHVPVSSTRTRSPYDRRHSGN